MRLSLSLCRDFNSRAPSEIARDVSVEAKLKQREELRAACAATEDVNKRLKASLEPKRKQVKEIQAKIDISNQQTSRLFTATESFHAEPDHSVSMLV